ncbi:hypothetical protein CLAIMM_09096 [Cladophialophora immunda]|nr:hypothetical protein CLAIMM_09096 [Cladophialophora immunda]
MVLHQEGRRPQARASKLKNGRPRRFISAATSSEKLCLGRVIIHADFHQYFGSNCVSLHLDPGVTHHISETRVEALQSEKLRPKVLLQNHFTACLSLRKLLSTCSPP